MLFIAPPSIICSDSYRAWMKKTTRAAAAKKARPKCVDLFAGAGGFSLAAKSAGAEVVAAVEKDAYACSTYEANIISKRGRTVLYEKDIQQISPTQFKRKHFPGTDQCDMLLGGPPCQGFSTHRIKSAGVGDPRNELVLRYFQFVKALRPKMFLMENVPGILWPRHKTFLRALYKEAKAAGYKIHPPAVLDARDYGVPQRRKRVFVLGVRNDIELSRTWPPPSTHGSSIEVEANPKLKKWIPAETVFATRLKAEDPNNIHMNHSAAMVSVFESTPLNGGSRRDSNRVLPCHKDHDGHKDVYGRIDPSLPGPTMTTACVNPSKGRFVHPTEHHGISVRHAARFQTFPDSFVFQGGLTAAAQQIGNAVPVVLGEVLIKFLLKSMRPKIVAGKISAHPPLKRSSRPSDASPGSSTKRGTSPKSNSRTYLV